MSVFWDKYIGNKFSTGAVPVGKSLNQITFWLTTTDDSVNHDLSAYVYDSGDNVVATSTSTINNNTLKEDGTPGAVNDFTECAFTFAGTYTIADGDRLVIKNTSSVNIRIAQTYTFASEPNPAYCDEDDCPLVSHQIYQCVTSS